MGNNHWILTERNHHKMNCFPYQPVNSSISYLSPGSSFGRPNVGDCESNIGGALASSYLSRLSSFTFSADYETLSNNFCISFPDLLGYSWHIILCKFRVHVIVIWLCIHCAMFTTIRLVKPSVNSHSYNFFVCVVRAFKIYSLSNFQVYNTVLLTIDTMLYTASLGCICLITRSLCILTVFTHSHPGPALPEATNLFSVSINIYF